VPGLESLGGLDVLVGAYNYLDARPNGRDENTRRICER
jgi:hypothetical protein